MIALTVTSVGEAIVWGAGVVGAIATMLRLFGVYILRPLSEAQVEKFDAKLQPLKDELATIRREVTYNGGLSLKDAVRRIEREQDLMRGKFEEHDRWVHRVLDENEDG